MKYLLEDILYRSFIPSDVIHNIIMPYFELKDSIKTSPINKYFNNECNTFIKSIKKIQRTFRKNRISKDRLDYIPTIMTYGTYLRLIDMQKKKTYYRYYMIHYPKEFLLNYPEYLVEKTSRYYDYDIIEKRWEWIRKNLPDIKYRKKRDILKFFVENDISVKDFIDTGW